MRRHDDELTAGLAHFVLDLSPGLARRHVEKRPIEPSLLGDHGAGLLDSPSCGSRHVPDLQVFHDDEGMIPRKAAGCLVLRIRSPARMARLQSAQPQDRLQAIAGALSAARNRLLDGSKLLLFPWADARKVEDVASACGDGVDDAEIDANRRTHLQHRRVDRLFNSDRHEPPAACLRDGDVLHLADDLTVDAQPHPSRLWQEDALRFPIHLDLQWIGIAERGVPELGARLRVCRAPLKEVLEGAVEIANCLLKGMMRHLPQKRCRGL